MKNNTIRGIVALVIVLALYLLLAFVIPFERTAVFWISFGFTLAAMAVAGLSVYLAFLRKGDTKSKFYGFPIARIGVIYGIAQLVAGLIFMALGAWIPVWIAVVVFALALGAAALGLVAADAVVEEIHEQDAKLKKEVSVMRALQSRVNQMVGQCDAPDAAAAVKKLAEELRYSDPVSSDVLQAAEQDLAAAIQLLQSAVVEGDSAAVPRLCRSASAILAERNRLCKLNK